jgi:hypothetical protein
VADHPLSDDDRAVLEAVEQLVLHPIDVNRAYVGDLMAIPWLDYRVAAAIVNARESLGGFRQIDSVKSAAGIADQLWRSLAPMLRVSNRRATMRGGAIARVGRDSLWPAGSRMSAFARVRSSVDDWSAAALVEKDPADSHLLDCLAGSVTYSSRDQAIVIGDIDAGIGQGLHFSGARGRSGLDGLSFAPAISLRATTAAPEVARLFGIGARRAVGQVEVFGLYSRVRRDARLRTDGSVERLILNGTHGDSLQLAQKGVLSEGVAMAGASLGFSSIRATLAASWCEYGAEFVPVDSTRSFAGRRLATGSIGLDWQTGGYQVGVEVARSSPGGGAIALALSLDRQPVKVQMAVRTRQAAYFAPHSRWTSLSERPERTDASGTASWTHRGLTVRLAGNTYREYEADSLPARVRLDAEQDLGALTIRASVGRSFRGEEERSRDAALRTELRMGPHLRLGVVLDDRYREQSPGHGTAVQINARLGVARADLVVSVTRTWVTPGMTIYLAEPGMLRLPGPSSVRDSGWRAAGGIRLNGLGPLTAALGANCSLQPQPVVGAGLQLEVAAP